MSVNLDGSRWAVGDDPVIDIAVTRDGTAYDLTGSVMEIVVTGPTVATTYTLASDGVSPKITIAAGTGGTATADFGGKMETAGTYEYRAHVTLAGAQLTFDTGAFTVF